MITLKVEIKDEQFLYEYQVGDHKAGSTTRLCAENMALFTDLLRMCSNHWRHTQQERDREILREGIRLEMENASE